MCKQIVFNQHDHHHGSGRPRRLFLSNTLGLVLVHKSVEASCFIWLLCLSCFASARTHWLTRAHTPRSIGNTCPQYIGFVLFWLSLFYFGLFKMEATQNSSLDWLAGCMCTGSCTFIMQKRVCVFNSNWLESNCSSFPLSRANGMEMMPGDDYYCPEVAIDWSFDSIRSSSISSGFFQISFKLLPNCFPLLKKKNSRNLCSLPECLIEYFSGAWRFCVCCSIRAWFVGILFWTGKKWFVDFAWASHDDRCSMEELEAFLALFQPFLHWIKRYTHRKMYANFVYKKVQFSLVFPLGCFLFGCSILVGCSSDNLIEFHAFLCLGYIFMIKSKTRHQGLICFRWVLRQCTAVHTVLLDSARRIGFTFSHVQRKFECSESEGSYPKEEEPFCWITFFVMWKFCEK